MKTVIFDLDGVLIDSEDFHCKAWINAYKHIGINIDEKYYYNKIQGIHGEHSTKKVLADFKKEVDSDSLISQKEEYAAKLLQSITPIFGSVDLVNLLYSRGYKLGLASSSSMNIVSMVLSKFKLDDKFMVVHGGQAVSNGKPSPEVYLKTARLLEADADDCVVIEDSKSGIISAKSAGMKCIGVLNGRNKREDLMHADLVVDSISEIDEEIIENI